MTGGVRTNGEPASQDGIATEARAGQSTDESGCVTRTEGGGTNDTEGGTTTGRRGGGWTVKATASAPPEITGEAAALPMANRAKAVTTSTGAGLLQTAMLMAAAAVPPTALHI